MDATATVTSSGRGWTAADLLKGSMPDPRPPRPAVPERGPVLAPARSGTRV